MVSRSLLLFLFFFERLSSESDISKGLQTSATQQPYAMLHAKFRFYKQYLQMCWSSGRTCLLRGTPAHIYGGEERVQINTDKLDVVPCCRGANAVSSRAANG